MMDDYIEVPRAEWDALRARVVALEAALRKYGSHVNCRRAYDACEDRTCLDCTVRRLTAPEPTP